MKIIALILLSLSCRAADIVLGIGGPTSWLDYIGQWGSVSERSDFGAWMHLDASYAAGMSNSVVNGTNFVVEWHDWRNSAVYAGKEDYYTTRPFQTDNYHNGKTVVRFQPFAELSQHEAGPMLRFSTDRSGDIFGVFAVVRLNVEAVYTPFLGGTESYAFHGSMGGQLIHPEWSDAKVNTGSNSMDGVSMSIATIYPTNVFHVVSVRTSGGGVSANNLGRDRASRAGGIDFAELLIFTNPVSDAVTTSINAYLKAKWATP